MRTDLVARFIAAAHDRGINVVAWYLPSLADPGRDFRRTMRAIRFRTIDGDGFDSFALDIESRLVRSPARRTSRLLWLRRPRSVVCGAFVRARGDRSVRAKDSARPRVLARFPYRGLARSFDVFLPMTYFAYGPKGARGRADTLYDVALIRRGTRDLDRSDSRDRRDREPRQPVGGQRVREHGVRLRSPRGEPLRLLGHAGRPVGDALADHQLVGGDRRGLPLKSQISVT